MKNPKRLRFQPAHTMIVLGEPVLGHSHAVPVSRNPSNTYVSIVAGDNYKMLVNGQEVIMRNDPLPFL